MVSGKHLSEKEKEYIREHHTECMNCTIAAKLAESFADDNDGFRSNVTVKRFLRREYPEQYPE